MDIRLTPMILADLADFGMPDLPHRMLHGGLPPFFLARAVPEAEIQDWLDAYWAKDIQTLFRLERRASFERFFELLLAQSGWIFEASNFASPCEVSRPTVANYLCALEATYVAHVLRPFSGRRASEIVSAPKVYGFDTGFVCALRGWNSFRAEDAGYLWEHLVLNELLARVGRQGLGYWRDKRGHEVDFVFAPRGGDPTAIECKWRADRFEPAALRAFRRSHPKGRNFIVAHDIDRPIRRHYGEIEVVFCSLERLIKALAGK